MRVRTRTSARLAVAVAAAVSLAVAGAPAASATRTAGGIASPALGARVVFDEYGVPHVYAGTLAGLFFGDGWVTGEERLWQADLVRRTATGTLSALIGPGAGNSHVLSDEYFRQYTGGTAGLTRLLAGLDRSSRISVDAFVAGLNAEIAAAEHNGTLPLEYTAVHATPQLWTAQDVLASGMLSVVQVGTTGADELANAAVLQDLVARLGPAAGGQAFADTHWLDDPSAPTTVPSAPGRSHPAANRILTASAGTQLDHGAVNRTRALLTAAAQQSQALGFGGPGHSNAIALAGRLTRSGQPLLLGGPQIGYSTPQGFMELSLHGAGFDATGVTLAGVPGVLIGAGFDHAWTVTTGGDDNQDLYVETLDPVGHPGAYLFDGQWRPYSCRTETVQVAGGSPVTFPACESIHGPVLSMSGSTAIALRDATRNRVGDTLRAFFGIDQAHNLNQFVRSAQRAGGSLNFTYADTKGHIAYTHVGPVPIRPASDNRFLPHPGDGSDEWLGFLPTSQLPLVVDPARGWLANWNNKPEPGWTNSSDGFWQWGPVQRVQVITRQLDRIAPHTATMATLERINQTTGQTAETPPGNPDVLVVQALLRPMLANVDPSTDPRLAPVLALLRSWDQQRVDQNGDGTYDSPALTVFTAWYATFVTQVLVPTLGSPFAVGGADENTTANVVSRLLAGHRAALPLTYDYLHGTSLHAAVTNSLVAALDALTARYGTADRSRWLTSDVTISWDPLGAGSVPSTPWMNRGTYNQILSLDKAGPRGENVVAPGESGDVRSPHFADQLSLYATWQYKPMWISQADVQAHATTVEMLTP